VKTFEARIMIEVDADSIAEMLERLGSLSRAPFPDGVRVLGYQWDRVQGQEPKTPDIRQPGWRSYLKDRR
jgi:hypothetical protein